MNPVYGIVLILAILVGFFVAIDPLILMNDVVIVSYFTAFGCLVSLTYTFAIITYKKYPAGIATLILISIIRGLLLVVAYTMYQGSFDERYWPSLIVIALNFVLVAGLLVARKMHKSHIPVEPTDNNSTIQPEQIVDSIELTKTRSTQSGNSDDYYSSY